VTVSVFLGVAVVVALGLRGRSGGRGLLLTRKTGAFEGRGDAGDGRDVHGHTS
jgi:hypothetical protein